MDRTPSLFPVGSIVGRSAEVQMLDVVTVADVAVVQNVHALGDSASQKVPRNLVRPVTYRPRDEEPVAVPSVFALPTMAAVLVDVRP